jgi:glycosyltransferase involved in cell wall biosynthesis
VGRVVWQKNPEAAAKVSFVLSRLGVAHELLLACAGPEINCVLTAIRQSEAADRIRVLRDVRDMNAFYAGIDVLLMTSRFEGLPYAGLDAMARGIPLVGFDVPGIRDLVEHGVTGLLGPSGDAGSLAAQLARLAGDVDLHRTMGARARERVRKEYQLEHQFDQLCALYHTFI